MREFVVFDLEANADRSDPPAHEIIDIGAVLIADGAEAGQFETLVRPTRPLRLHTRKLTGLTDDELAQAPTLGEALRTFAAFVGDRPLMAHNGFGYDYPLLDAAAEQTGLPAIGGRRLDTLELAHVVFPRAGQEIVRNVDGSSPPKGRNLDDLVQCLVGQTPRDIHRALGDARLLAAVVPHLLTMLDEDDAARRLQRWVLGTAGHPWTEFLTSIGQLADLSNVVPDARLPEPEPGPHPVEPERAAAMLDEGGVLMSRGRRPRPQQVQMARRVSEALCSGTRQLIEAPTGTGKTLAYLVPAIEHARATGSTVAIAPHSKVLQDQIMLTLEGLSEELSPFNAALVKGRSNYLSLDALAGELDALAEQDSSNTDTDRALALSVVCGWVSQTPTGDWDDLRTWTLKNPHKAMPGLRLVLSAEDGVGPARTVIESREFHRRAREGLRRCHIAVLNHALVVSDEEWLDYAKLLVLDEAHNLEDAATDALSQEVSAWDLVRLCDALDDPVRRHGTVYRLARATGWPLAHEHLDALRRAVKAVRGQVAEFGAQAVHYLRVRTAASTDDTYPVAHRLRVGADTAHPDYYPVLQAGRELASALRDVSGALNGINLPEQLRGRYRRERLEREMNRLGRLARSCAKTVRRVVHADESDQAAPGGTAEAAGASRGTAIGSPESEQWIAIAEIAFADDAWTWTLRRSPVSVAGALRTRWASLDAAVLTSATLAVGGSFDHIIGSLGLGAVQTLVLPSPFERLPQNHLLVLTDYLPAPRARLIHEFTNAAVQEIGRLLLLSDGRGLVLSTARARMERTRDHLRPVLESYGMPLLAQGDAPAPALVEKMRSETATSLLALRSFWEGVDIPGEALSLLILEKVPFDSPADPVVGARMAALEDRGKDPFADYAVPRAALRFAQGAGRLIRTADDRGVTVVLDNRLCRATAYRDQLLGTLPGPPTTKQARHSEEAYRLIAKHLGDVAFDEDKRAKLMAVPSIDPWEHLDALRLTPEEAHDPRVVTARLDQVREEFGFESWRPGQLETMSRFIAGEDVLAVLPTGSGKSITFQIPALLLEGITLVISPLVALMNDQVGNLRDRGITRAAAIHSGIGQSEWRDVLRGAQRGDYKLLYVSPERLWLQEFVEALSAIGVARIAVDEAHCISQWGHSFRPPYARIPTALNRIIEAARGRSGKRRPPVLAVTATANKRVRDDIMSLLESAGDQPIVESPDRPELRYYTERCTDRRDRDVRAAQIVDAHRSQAAIVYVPTQRDAVRVAGLLQATGHLARHYHGAMETAARQHVEDAFRHDEIDVVVATKAFGMGIDKPDIALIVHLEMPATIEEFVQETGRAARGAGQPGMPQTGTAVLLTMPRDCSIHRRFVRSAAPQIVQIRRVWGQLRSGLAAYDPKDMVSDDEGTDSADVEAALAMHYLEEAGALRRHPDTAWRGRVTLLEDSLQRLTELAVGTDGEAWAELVARSEQLMEQAEACGGHYEAEAWARALGRSASDNATDLLELQRKDIAGFSVWRYAWVLERFDVEPDWASIEERADRRRNEVKAKSDRARRFAHPNNNCRVAAMLDYLDAANASGRSVPSGQAQTGCGRCDHCVDLPRPWAGSHLTETGLQRALPVRRIALSLLHDVDGHGFSRRNIERTLAGDVIGSVPQPHQGHIRQDSPVQSSGNEHGRRPVPKGLAQHPTAGRLAFVGRTGVSKIIDQLVEEGLVELVSSELEGTAYDQLTITEAGRGFL